MMTNNDKNTQLNRLLQIKRMEMPSEKEWKNFSIAFENKKLIAMREHEKRVPLITFLRHIAKKSLLRIASTSIVCATAIGICLLSHNNETINYTNDITYVKFVADKLSISDDLQAFVINDCGDINMNTSTEYVQDILTIPSHHIMASL